MKTQDVLFVYPSNEEEVTVLKTILEALKIKFEFSKEETYNPEFVEKIMESKRQIAQGNFTEVKKENLKSFIDSL
jgi:hypothetical protein